MTSCVPVVPVGAQRPRFAVFPDAVSTDTGRDAVELAASAGLLLDPWQQFVLERVFAEDEFRRWAAFEVALVVPRQNGKGALLEAIELAGLFLLDERFIIHSAHEFGTSLEAFRRLEQLVQDTPEFHKRVKPRGYKHSHGEEGIEFRNGQRIRFRTRTKGGGRGFSATRVILDEAMILPEAMMGAILPVMSAQSVTGNPQIIYTGSSVDQVIHDDGGTLARLRARGLAGGDPSLAYIEWSAEVGRDDGRPVTPDDVTEEMASDPAVWASANPGLGIRISVEHVENERRALAARTFAVERLGVGDWPSVTADTGVISVDNWSRLADRMSELVDPVCFAFDVTPDRSRSCVSVAGVRPDGLRHVEVVEHRRGTEWVAARVAELVAHHRSVGVVYDATGPAASLAAPIIDAGVELTPVSSHEHGQACGMVYDLVEQAALRHLGQPELVAAVRGAAKRPMGDAWAWSRKSSAVDISPLVSVTLALWGSVTIQPVAVSAVRAFSLADVPDDEEDE